MFSRVEHEKSFITSRPVLTGKLKTHGFFYAQMSKPAFNLHEGNLKGVIFI